MTVQYFRQEMRLRASDRPTHLSDELDEQGFPSEQRPTELLTEEGAWLNEDAAYEDEAQGYEDEYAMEQGAAPQPEYAESFPGDQPYTPYGAGGGGGGAMPYYPTQAQMAPQLPVGTPPDVQAFVTALQNCTATQEQASALVSSLTAANMPGVAQWVVTAFAGQAEKCKAATVAPATGPKKMSTLTPAARAGLVSKILPKPGTPKTGMPGTPGTPGEPSARPIPTTGGRPASLIPAGSGGGPQPTGKAGSRKPTVTKKPVQARPMAVGFRRPG